MKNLKKVLALTLAVAMVFAMVVSASAATFNDYSDKSDVTNVDAVSMLTELSVLKGYPDGSFKPTQTVTRAEMAKMIAVILNKGNENCNELYLGVNTGLTDVSWNWAAGYINYCYSLGIIAGYGDGTFKPSQVVTGTEAAKMLLVALGYDETIEGLEGTNWELNANALAAKAGLYDDVAVAVSTGASRDTAALLVYNALTAPMVLKYEDGTAMIYTGTGNKQYETLLEKMYNATKVEGVITANEYADLQGDEALAAGNTRIGTKVYKVTTTKEQLGQAVTVFIKNSDNKAYGNVILSKDNNVVVEKGDEKLTKILKNGSLKTNDETVYLINYAEDAVTDEYTLLKAGSSLFSLIKNNYDKAYTGTAGTTEWTALYVDDVKTALDDLASAKKGDTIDSTAYDVLEYVVDYLFGVGDISYDITDVVDVGTTVSDADIKDNKPGKVLTVIDNDNDGVADYVLQEIDTLVKITKVNSKDEEITISKAVTVDSDGKDILTISLDDISTADTLAKDDIILIRYVDGTYYANIAPTTSGVVNARSTAAGGSVTVDSTKYLISGISNLTDDDKIDTYAYSSVKVGKTYTFYMDNYGNVIAYKGADLAYNYAFVSAVGYSSTSLSNINSMRASVVGANNKVYDINDDGDYLSGKVLRNYSSAGTYGPTASDLNTLLVTTLSSTMYPLLTRYDEIDDGEITVIEPLAQTKVTTATSYASYASGTTKIGGYSVNVDTVFFVVTKDSDDSTELSVKAYKGYRNAPDVAGTVANTEIYVADVNSNSVAGAVVIYTTATVRSKSSNWMLVAGSDSVESGAVVFSGITASGYQLEGFKYNSTKTSEVDNKSGYFYYYTTDSNGYVDFNDRLTTADYAYTNATIVKVYNKLISFRTPSMISDTADLLAAVNTAQTAYNNAVTALATAQAALDADNAGVTALIASINAVTGITDATEGAAAEALVTAAQGYVTVNTAAVTDWDDTCETEILTALTDAKTALQAYLDGLTNAVTAATTAKNTAETTLTNAQTDYNTSAASVITASYKEAEDNGYIYAFRPDGTISKDAGKFVVGDKVALVLDDNADYVIVAATNYED